MTISHKTPLEQLRAAVEARNAVQEGLEPTRFPKTVALLVALQKYLPNAVEQQCSENELRRKPTGVAQTDHLVRERLRVLKATPIT